MVGRGGSGTFNLEGSCAPTMTGGGGPCGGRGGAAGCDGSTGWRSSPA